jgi:hypothetical protein
MDAQQDRVQQQRQSQPDLQATVCRQHREQIAV